MELSKEKYGVGNIACEKCGGWDDVETYEDPDFGLWGECQKCKTKWEVIEDTHPELSGCPTEHYTGDEIKNTTIECPKCKGLWDIGNFNSCQCGATLKTMVYG